MATEFCFEHTNLYCSIDSRIKKEQHFDNNENIFCIVGDDIRRIQHETVLFLSFNVIKETDMLI